MGPLNAIKWPFASSISRYFVSVSVAIRVYQARPVQVDLEAQGAKPAFKNGQHRLSKHLAHGKKDLPMSTSLFVRTSILRFSTDQPYPGEID